jgi:hypothetical protein
MENQNSEIGVLPDDNLVADDRTASKHSAEMSPEPPKTQLDIKGPGLTFSREISDTMVLKIMGIVLGDSGAHDEPQTKETECSEEQRGGRREALSEYYRRVAPRRYSEKLTTIASYLQDVLGRQPFAPEDLRRQFRQVNETPPTNLSRDFRLALGEGWIAEEPNNSGQYYVTPTGLEAVRKRFSNDISWVSKPRRRRRSATKRVKEEIMSE